ncbi:MAG: FG-GAP repeat protein [Pyrinomonadaceae bacterium]
MFTRSGTVWTQQQRITAPDGLQDDNFGSSTSIQADTWSSALTQ